MASKTVEHVLFPGIDVRVERVSDSSGGLVVEAVSTARPSRCPDCRKQARRVHSSYQRTLAEGPLGSRQVMVRLRAHRYFCDRKSCSRRTFVQEVGGLTERHRRSSVGLTDWLRAIAVELGAVRPRGCVTACGWPAAWLAGHPGAEIICRDRATAYTTAVKEAAPDALEVAPLAFASEPVRRGGEDLPPAPQLPAHTY
ncbi:transposase family protein [Streptomyces sp. Inha503]|uniref:transposase family protein n=1 Tax=Streptomyces sp. Inha503 TaxID=3383314 RepID=UPI0039A230A2